MEVEAVKVSNFPEVNGGPRGVLGHKRGSGCDGPECACVRVLWCGDGGGGVKS